MTQGCYRLELKHLHHLKEVFCIAKQNYLEGYSFSGHLGLMTEISDKYEIGVCTDKRESCLKVKKHLFFVQFSISCRMCSFLSRPSEMNDLSHRNST